MDLRGRSRIGFVRHDVAGGRDRLLELGSIGRGGIERDGRRTGLQDNRRRPHSANPLQGALNRGNAMPAGHPLHGEFDGFE